MGADHVGDEVLAEVVVAGLDGRGPAELLEQRAGLEDVDAHRGEAAVGVARNAERVLRLFIEATDPALFIDPHHAEMPAFGNRHGYASKRAIGVRPAVFLEEQRIVHLVDVIAGEDEDIRRVRLLDGVDVLVDGVCGSAIPEFAQTLLRRQDIDEFTEFPAEESPRAVDVPIETGGLVLRKHQDFPQPAVDAVREREIDDAVDAAERNGGLGAIDGEGLETRPLSAG